MANTEQRKGPKVPSRAASLQRMLEIERKQKVSFHTHLFNTTTHPCAESNSSASIHN